MTLVEELPLLLSVEIEQLPLLVEQLATIQNELTVAHENIAPQVTVLLSEGYIGPLGVDRTNADGMLICQFPLCIRKVFIWY